MKKPVYNVNMENPNQYESNKPKSILHMNAKFSGANFVSFTSSFILFFCSCFNKYCYSHTNYE